MTDTPPPRRPSPRRGAWAWTLVLVASTAVVAWMAIGPLDEDVPNPQYLTYIVEVPDLPRTVEAAVAVLAGVVAALSVRKLRRSGGRQDPIGAFALVAAVVLGIGSGVLLGGSGRAITTGADGANIGAGLAILFVLPLALVLALIALAAAQHRARVEPSG